MEQKVAVTHKSGKKWNNKLIEDYFLPLGYYVVFDEACAKGKNDVVYFEINKLNPKELFINVDNSIGEKLGSRNQEGRLLEKVCQDDLVMLPHIGMYMGAYATKEENGVYDVLGMYIIEAIDGTEMTIRLRDTGNETEILKGKFICFRQPDSSCGIIFREDIQNNSFPITYTEIPY